MSAHASDRQVDRPEAFACRSGRRRPPWPVPRLRQRGAEPDEHDVDRGTGDHLVAAIRDAGIAVHHRETIANKKPAASPTQAEPVSAAAAAAAKAAASILPSKPISTTPERSENRPARAARTSGAASRMVHQASSETWRPARPCRLRHQAPPGRRRLAARNIASSRGRNMFSRAPENRITRPWMTTTISRLSRGTSNETRSPW